MGAPGKDIYSGILARNQVFFDDMETGDTKWAHDATNPDLDTWALTVTGPPLPEYGPPYSYSGAWSFTDSPYDPVEDEFDYEADTDSWLGPFDNINLVDQFGTKLTFYIRYDLDCGST